MSINKVILVGNVGQDPNVRAVQGGTKVANLTLATTEKFKDKEETEWHNVTVWNNQAEVVEKYVQKGTQLYVEGRIKTEKYTKDGQERSIVKIVATTIQLLGKKEGASAPATAPESPAPRTTYKSTPIPSAGEDDGDDLPFN